MAKQQASKAEKKAQAQAEADFQAQAEEHYMLLMEHSAVRRSNGEPVLVLATSPRNSRCYISLNVTARADNVAAAEATKQFILWATSNDETAAEWRRDKLGKFDKWAERKAKQG